MPKYIALALITVTILLISGCCTQAHKPTPVTPPTPTTQGEKSEGTKCLLQVNGKKYIDGACKYEKDDDNAFRIYGGDYFAYVMIDNGKAEVSWNAAPENTHAQAYIGSFTQEGDCWTHANNKLCVWE